MFFNKSLWVSKWDKVDSHAKTTVHHKKSEKSSEIWVAKVTLIFQNILEVTLTT